MVDSLTAAAERLKAAEINKDPCAPIRDLIALDDEASAYAIQNMATERKLQSGRRLVGRKIGLTNPAVQQQLGVNQPDFGMLFDDMQREESDIIAYDDVMQPKIEAEIAFILSSPLTKAHHTADDIIKATRSVVAAFEIVGSRIAKWDIKFVDTVADNASSGLFVLGSVHKAIHEIDLTQCAMRMTRSGEEVSKGSGTACMGNPINAAIWLADKMVQMGRPLGAGDIILSGALGPMVAVQPGDRFEASVEGLGQVKAAFGTRD